MSTGCGVLPVITGLREGDEWTEPTTDMEFVYVPGGTFMMGDIFGDGDDDEKPVHGVRLDGFYIGKYPVTQGQWKKVTGNNPSEFKKGDNYPAEQVSWNNAQAFITKLAAMSDGKYRFSLPTEAQWEYAARSGGKKERYAGGDDIDAVAWYGKNSNRSTRPVGTKKPNGLGIYDMSGNVWEWCQDWHESYTASAVVNPTGADTGSERVLRGGSWGSGARNCRTADRFRDVPRFGNSSIGFRLVVLPGQQGSRAG
ncbi:MAG: formylglycine-generating enzyme family protein [Gammaproteobacteria bacterium]|nr:formylglycine-generating enzyme family protein [Gammaproteobacteria bacterium]